MKAKTITRVMVAGVAAPMLAFGLPSAALAGSFWHGDAQFAGPHGATSQSITAIAGHGHHGHGFGHGGHGGGFALYKASSTVAGPHGAASQNLFSFAD
ncbi:hypothetical protein [Nocardiopsis sp. FIRDI 009]|uniref:hypothetical protein n=1 Tax=Nocardiopsis sp. FIRDI 009 TaxID=714197 RepID=UPI000E220725|nr:hypothetical protein [Nocardiopsis sp. FIRDI 009]